MVPSELTGLVARGCYYYFYGHGIRVPIQTLTNKEIVSVWCTRGWPKNISNITF